MPRKPKAHIPPARQPDATLAILAESQRIGWPVRFQTDLQHDATAIAGMQPREPFSWCLRADGTHIGRIAESSDQSRLTMRMVAEAFGADACRFYVWDGTTLQSMHSAEAADTLLGELAARRFAVRTVRNSSLLPAEVASLGEADRVAQDWRNRFGEEFTTVDTWAVRQ